MTSARSPFAPSAPKSLSLIRSARCPARLPMIVRCQRVDGVIIWDWVCGCAGRPCPKLGGDQATRRTAIGPYSPPPPCIYVFRAPKRPLRPHTPWRASNSSPPSTPRSGGARRSCISWTSSSPKRARAGADEPSSDPEPPELQSQILESGSRHPRLPEGARLASRAPACIMVRGDDGAVGRAAGPVRPPQDVRRISDDPASREPRDHRPGGQRHRQLVDQSRVR
jgi:hypothetical protein